MSHRWKVVLDNLGMDLIFKDVIKIFWIGLFFNQVLPSSIGGDSFRGFYIYRKGFSLVETTQGVLVDRIIGLLALVILVIITLPLGLGLIENNNAKLGLITILTFAILGLITLLNLDKFMIFFKDWKFYDPIMSITIKIREIIYSKKPGLKLLSISLLVHFLSILTVLCLSKGMGLDIEFKGIILIIPLVTLLMMIPISIAGWGVREGAMIVGLGFLGVEAESAFALSLIFGFISLLVSVPGGPIWILINGNIKQSF